MPASANASTVRSTQVRPKIVEPSTAMIVARSSASSGLPLICTATNTNQHAPDATMQTHAATATRKKRVLDEPHVRSRLPEADALIHVFSSGLPLAKETMDS